MQDIESTWDATGGTVNNKQLKGLIWIHVIKWVFFEDAYDIIC